MRDSAILNKAIAVLVQDTVDTMVAMDLEIGDRNEDDCFSNFSEYCEYIWDGDSKAKKEDLLYVLEHDKELNAMLEQGITDDGELILEDGTVVKYRQLSNLLNKAANEQIFKS